MADALATRLLVFWFGAPQVAAPVEFREIWFKRDDGFDAAIKRNFAADVEAALGGALGAMAADPEGALALLLLLDQFPRNLFRGAARSYAGDAQARRIADFALARGFDAAMSPNHRIFLYLPFEHSEATADQDRSVALFATLDDARAHDYAMRHRDVIARFGRFPHRNEALGRASTAAEIAFLGEPGSSF